MTFHLGVALDGYGWHTHAWALTQENRSVLSGGYWAELALTAERGLLDFLTIDDSLMPQPGRRERIDPHRLAGRGDAVLLAARIAPVTRHIGLIPVATVTHTEPFHISKAIATLDHVSHGRAGWQPRVSVTTHEAALFGRRTVRPEELFPEARDYVEVVRRLWDSWEDGAVIRDAATGRYIDRDKLHYIDFTGQFFSVKGPSITPRPPQGQPVIATLAHATPVYEFAADTSDIVFVTPTDTSVQRLVDEVRGIGEQLKVFADIVVSFHGETDFRSDTLVWGGGPADLVDMLLAWRRAGADGARLRPAAHATDLPVIVDEVVPMLQRAGEFRSEYLDGETLRERLGLPVAVNRYTGVHR